jgi:ISXO2-like transposase domain
VDEVYIGGRPRYKGVSKKGRGTDKTPVLGVVQRDGKVRFQISNTVESVFSLIRRGVVGTFHSISRKHLPNYLNEFQFRWDTRKMNDGQRVAAAIKQIDGKRLEYRESVENPPYLSKPTGQMEAPFQEEPF